MALNRLRLYTENLPSRVGQGRGIVLFGPPGTGKDHLMASLAFVAMLKHGIRVEWLSGLDFYGDCRDRIESGDPESKAIRHHANPGVLAISDPLAAVGRVTALHVEP